ncbi:MAG TPA: SIR2 family protein [Burkholderiales bacterium]|nr:SIR2 family protein [Burkholderiales bacterium]
MPFDYLTTDTRALEALSSNLVAGTLVLFLGAGTSLGAGLPDWPTLIVRLRTLAKLPIDKITAGASSDELQAAADEVLREFCKGDDELFARMVKEALYEDVTLSETILHNDALIALGALMTGSRRGKVSRAITFNFDSVLEWYLSLCGIVPRVVLQPPTLEGAEDVRVYHPHGFLAHPDLKSRDSRFVILGLHAVNKRLGTIGDPWFEMLRHLLRSGVGLFVGVSPRTFRDRALAPLLVAVGEELKDVRPTAFWIMPEDTDNRDELQREFLSTNVVPLFRSKGEIPGFLLSICRHAAQGVIV